MRRRHIIVDDKTLCGWDDMTIQELRHQKRNKINTINCMRCLKKHRYKFVTGDNVTTVEVMP